MKTLIANGKTLAISTEEIIINALHFISFWLLTTVSLLVLADRISNTADHIPTRQ